MSLAFCNRRQGANASAVSGQDDSTAEPGAQTPSSPSAEKPPSASNGASSGGREEDRLISAGEEFIRRMKDPATDPQELSDVARHAIVAKEFSGMLAARDEKGRSPLHVCATRGDLGLCREMIKADPGLVNAIDHNKSTPLMDAAHLGRAMIVKELVSAAADACSERKNADLMNALQLACVNEGAGNGEVVEELIKAGADPQTMCWQVTPMMAAADSGHIWAVQALLDMGADPWQKNGAYMAALDYARDIETSTLLYDVMQGNQISNRPAPRFDTTKLFKDAEARRAKLHRSVRELPLEDAFAALEIPSSWLPDFRESGEHYNDIRKVWRRVCLTYHPDKQPEDLEEEAAAEWTAKFQTAVAAFEAIDKHFRHVCQDDELRPE